MVTPHRAKIGDWTWAMMDMHGWQTPYACPVQPSPAPSNHYPVLDWQAPAAMYCVHLKTSAQQKAPQR